MPMELVFDGWRAQERATLGSRRKERRALRALLGFLGGAFFCSAADATPFQQYTNGVCHPAIPACDIGFAAVPAGKRLEIDNVSCHVRVDGDHALDSVYLYADEQIFFLAPEVVAGGARTTIYAANHSIFAFAKAGQHFSAGMTMTLGVSSNGVISQFACHISGRLIDA
jgi:hypothetical protein